MAKGDITQKCDRVTWHMAVHAGLGHFRHRVWKVQCTDASLQSAVDVDLSLRGGTVVCSVVLSGSDLLPHQEKCHDFVFASLSFLVFFGL
jgi:hypothetical protein